MSAVNRQQGQGAKLESIWVQWSNCGNHIRRWQRTPFEAGEEITGLVVPTTALMTSSPNPTTQGVKADVYRGWSVGFEYGWFSAVHPEYEASYEGSEDGWVGSHPILSGRTREEMQAEVDAWFEERGQ